jgi:NAD(P)-dependent dehydrogenase (short-subunit alcohol dehydrogenase family)
MGDLTGSEGLGGKVALVTGGSRGIGAAIGRRLARDGADVAVTYRSAKDQADGVVAAVEAEGRRAVALRADAADADAVVDAVDEAARRLGRLDVLVNNAGVFPYGPLGEVTRDEVDTTVAVHVRAAFLASQAATRHLGEGGRIISIGSNIAIKVPFAGVSLYAMTKAALVGLTKGLAHDLAPRGITANLVAPGSTDTEMNPADGPTADAERSLIPLGRYCDPAEIAAAVAFLAGPGAAGITGTTITVDGGTTA